MEKDEEKFFEELAKFGRASQEPDINVDFAKATSAMIRRPASYVRPSESRPAKKFVKEGLSSGLSSKALASVEALVEEGASSVARAEKGLSSRALAEEGQLTIDVYQTPEDIVVQSAIAGVKPEDIDIDVSPDSITIRGERQQEQEVSEEDYLYQECYWGRFSRSVILPQEIDPEQASVTFKSGVLVIRLPKVSRPKSKKLKIVE
jgi:HSP20 family protein